MHENLLLHRDVKPENVVLATPPPGHTGRWVAKLCDLGLHQVRRVASQRDCPAIAPAVLRRQRSGSGPARASRRHWGFRARG
jgi:serine/threonine protein kinase